MKTRDKIIISIVIGLIAMTLYSFPMWWGVLFSPITRQLTAVPVAEARQDGFSLMADGIILRFKSLDLLFSFLHSS